MSQEEYIKQLEDENAALKKKLEEKPVEEYSHNKMLNIKHLSEITEENPLIITDSNNKPLYKLVSVCRGKRNGYAVMKMKIRTGWIIHGWKNKEMFGWMNEWYQFPICSGGAESDKANGLITDSDISMAQGFFRMLETIGLINRDDKKVGL
jgi:hypothetical protein